MMIPHLTEDDIVTWLAGEASSETQRHASECQVCADKLAEAEKPLARFREAAQRWSDHHYAQQPRSTTMEAHPQEAQPRRRSYRVAFAGAMAALLLLAVLQRPKARVDSQAVAAEEPFVRIPYVVSAAPYERTSIRRMEIPLAALRSAGFDVNLADPSASLSADVLVGQDGRALAVRLLRSSRFHSR
jgi:hypothetical protein